MKRTLGYLLIALGIAISIPIAMMLFDVVHLPIPLFILLHILSGISGLAGFYLITKDEQRNLLNNNIWWLFALVASLSIPFYGLITTIAIYTIQKLRGHKPPPVVSDEITVQSPDVFSKPMTRTHQLEVLDRLDIEPFVDIFRRGQQELKKSAIKFLGTIRSKSALRTLNRALMDEDVEIRLYAAGVLGMIDDDYAKEMDTRKTHFIENSDDKKTALSLVEIYTAYARSGLIDRISQEYYYTEAIQILSEFPADSEINYIVARCYYDMDKYDEAKDHAKRCLDEDRIHVKCNELICEILFAQRSYEELAQRIEISVNSEPAALSEEILAYWK